MIEKCFLSKKCLQGVCACACACVCVHGHTVTHTLMEHSASYKHKPEVGKVCVEITLLFEIQNKKTIIYYIYLHNSAPISNTLFSSIDFFKP